MARISGFQFPLKRKVVRNCAIVEECVCVLDVIAVALNSGEVKVTNVVYNGADVMPILDFYDAVEDLRQFAERQFLKSAAAGT